MQNSTRIAFNAYLGQVAKLNGIESPTKTFAAAPSVQQKLETKIQESSAFLSSINMHGVDEMEGEKLGLETTSTIAGRTDTTSSDREPSDIMNLDADGYKCVHTDFDTSIRYAQLDMWAKFADFQTKVRDAIVRQQALDRIMIGFNGTSIAADTDRATNPLLQDVNKGWFQKYREYAAERVMTEGASAGAITIGADGDYENLDALVYDAVNTFIHPVHQDRTDLVVICGRKLLSDKYFPLLNKQNPATEVKALDIIMSQKQLGGLGAVRAPYVPDGALLVTPLNNLSIYYQNGKRRRHIEENAKRSRIENYESSNEDYVVEDYAAGCVIENIQLL